MRRLPAYSAVIAIVVSTILAVTMVPAQAHEITTRPSVPGQDCLAIMYSSHTLAYTARASTGPQSCAGTVSVRIGASNGRTYGWYSSTSNKVQANHPSDGRIIWSEHRYCSINCVYRKLYH